MIPLKIELRSIRLSGLVLVASVLIACGDRPASEVEEVIRPAKLMTINIDGNGITREYPGTVSATQSVELGFEVAAAAGDLPFLPHPASRRAKRKRPRAKKPRGGTDKGKESPFSKLQDLTIAT